MYGHPLSRFSSIYNKIKLLLRISLLYFEVVLNISTCTGTRITAVHNRVVLRERFNVLIALSVV